MNFHREMMDDDDDGVDRDQSREHLRLVDVAADVFPLHKLLSMIGVFMRRSAFIVS